MRFVSTVPFLGMALILGSASVAQTPPATTPPAQAPATTAAPPAQAPATTTAQPSAIDPEAIAALERMGAFLRTLTAWGGSADITSEEVLESGQKVQYTGAIDVISRPPNHLRVNLDSTRKRRQYFYDGRTLTVWSPRQGFYATLDAPPTTYEMIRAMSERYDIVLPLADLFAMGHDPAILARITSGFFVGLEAVDDQVCLHYAFRQPRADWEIWIREGEQPLPCRLAITSMEDPAHPQYEVRFTWDLEPEILADTFTFTPPEGAERIPVATASASAQ